jgi:apolipoprotein N-acyltransferase
MFDPKGAVAFEYRKAHLVPGIEDRIIDPGTRRIPTLDTEYGRIGTAICYDLQFSQYILQISTNHIDLLLVPGYEWEGVTPLATRMGSVEALQNRTAFMRVTRGLSAAYDNRGRCLGQLNYFTTGENIFICDIPIQRSYSFYGSIGWLFPYVIVGLTGMLFGWYLLYKIPVALIRRLRRDRSV